MKKLRHFKCENEHVTERFVKDETRTIYCEECGKDAKRMLSAPRCFTNTVGASPSRHK